MKIEKIEIHHIAIQLVHPFTTSFSTQTVHPSVVVAVTSEGITGWGECTVGLGPFYSAESIGTCWAIIKNFLAPLLIGKDITRPEEATELLKRVRGNEMTKGGVVNAIWDLCAKAENKSLKEYIGGVRDRVKVGVSIGMEPTTELLLERISKFVDEGYARVKIKIKKGLEFETMSAAREKFPDLLLMADANSDYELSDIGLLKRLDPLNLLMLEQPLRHYDIIDHAKLQKELKTPVCLDESIHRPDDARYAIELNACKIINIKVGRVGGLTHAVIIHDMCKKAGIDLWCGGMFENGIGRATNLHMATLPHFTLPGDTSGTDKYFKKDITRPFVLNREDSTMTVPDGPGIGVEVDEDALKEFRLNYLEINK